MGRRKGGRERERGMRRLEERERDETGNSQEERENHGQIMGSSTVGWSGKIIDSSVTRGLTNPFRLALGKSVYNSSVYDSYGKICL